MEKNNRHRLLISYKACYNPIRVKKLGFAAEINGFPCLIFSEVGLMLFLRQCDKSDVKSAAQMLCIVYSELPQNESWQLDRAEKRIEMYISG